MADGETGTGTGAATGELTGDQSGAVTTQPWLAAIEGIPDDLKSDAVLNRYDSVEKALRGHVEARQLASSRLAVPGKDAKPEDWGKVYDALGRPKSAAEYDFGLEALPETADDATKTARAEMTGRYGELFHGLGLNSQQAAALVKADIGRIEQATADFYAKGEADITALKAELGADYEPQKEAAKKMFTSLFGDEAAAMADELDSKVGSGRLMRGMMKLAKAAGEHQRVDGGGGELTGEANAEGKLNALFQDAGWREKFNAGDAATVAQHTRLLEAARAQAIARG